MTSPTLRLLKTVSGWQLNAVIIVSTVVLTDVVVALVDVLLLGRVNLDSMKVSTLSGLIIATLVVSGAGRLRAQIAADHQRELEHGIARAHSHLELAMESTQMIFWEFHMDTGRFSYNQSQRAWLGLALDVDGSTLPDWLAQVHPDDKALFMQRFQAAQAPGSPDFRFDYRMRQAAGGWGWVHTQGRVLERDALGSPTLAVGSTLNITQRKQAELALQENKERLDLIFNDNPELMLISRLSDGQITEVNDAFVRITGHSRAQAIGNTTQGLGIWARPQDRQGFVDALVAQGRCINQETLFVTRSGEHIACELDAAITTIHGVAHIVNIVRDIRSRKRAEAELQNSEELLRTTLASTDEGILLLNHADQVLSANARFIELWHVPAAMAAQIQNGRLLAHVLGQLANPEVFQTQVDQLVGGVAQARDTLSLKDGRVFAVFTRALKVADQTGRIWCFKDITEQTQAQYKLQESLSLLQAVIDHTPVRIFWKDLDLRYLGCNPVFARDAGLRSASELVGKLDTDLSWAANAQAYNADDRLVMDSGVARLAYEEPQTTPAGSTIWLSTSKVPLFNAHGTLMGILGMYEDITDRKLAVQSLLRSEQRTQALYSLLRLVADNVPDMIWAKDLNKRYLFANKAVCEQLLLAQDTNEPLGKDDLFFALRQRASHPADPSWHTFGELCQNSDDITLTCKQAGQFDEFGNVQGKALYLDVRKAPLIGDQGAVIGVVGSARDVTAERDTQEKLRVAAAVLTNSSEALILSDANNAIIDVNPAFTRLTGYTLDEVVGRNPRFLHSGKQGDGFYKTLWAQVDATGRWQGEVWNRRKDGEVYAEWLTINTLYNDDGSVHRRVGLFSDITDKKRSEELVWTQANFDALTGLPNRRMFLDRLEQDLKKAHRGGFKLALMFVDLDHFKEVNDTLGHDVGDELLKQAAARIAACARQSDTVARIGGDEFTVILAELSDASGIDRIAQDILASMALPFELGLAPSFVSASIGITLYPTDATRLEDLMKNADQAMYVSKDAGRNRFSYFTRDMQSAAMYRMRLQEDLRLALSQQQFELHYQPIVALPSGQIHKAEALLRWQHPVRGAVSPAEFIPLAESCGLIHALGDWVFAQAAAQAKLWRARLDPGFQISVNVSPLQLQVGAEQFHWREHLLAQQLGGDAVVLEITEGLLLDKSLAVSNELLAYRDAGIQVAIDDFGTGYSAMAYLKQMDIDFLKIDQSFVRNLGVQTSDHALCEAIVVMAHKLGLRVIAEGVETPLQRDLLQAMGCDFAQGYLYAKALPADEFEQLLA